MTEKVVRIKYKRDTLNFRVYKDVGGELADFSKYRIPKTHPLAEDDGDLALMKWSHYLKLKGEDKE